MSKDIKMKDIKKFHKKKDKSNSYVKVYALGKNKNNYDLGPIMQLKALLAYIGNKGDYIFDVSNPKWPVKIYKWIENKWVKL